MRVRTFQRGATKRPRSPSRPSIRLSAGKSRARHLLSDSCLLQGNYASPEPSIGYPTVRRFLNKTLSVSHLAFSESSFAPQGLSLIALVRIRLLSRFRPGFGLPPHEPFLPWLPESVRARRPRRTVRNARSRRWNEGSQPRPSASKNITTRRTRRRSELGSPWETANPNSARDSIRSREGTPLRPGASITRIAGSRSELRTQRATMNPRSRRKATLRRPPPPLRRRKVSFYFCFIFWSWYLGLLITLFCLLPLKPYLFMFYSWGNTIVPFI